MNKHLFNNCWHQPHWQSLKALSAPVSSSSFIQYTCGVTSVFTVHFNSAPLHKRTRTEAAGSLQEREGRERLTFHTHFINCHCLALSHNQMKTNPPHLNVWGLAPPCPAYLCAFITATALTDSVIQHLRRLQTGHVSAGKYKIFTYI